MSEKKINLIVADMGYGHQRAAYPLLGLSGGQSITINNYEGIPEWEKEYWINNLSSYEKISRFKKVPILGSFVFSVMDYFQKVPALYPYRDLSRPTFQQKYFLKFIKKGLGKKLIEELNESGLPYVTTFFVAAYIAEYHDYHGDIYCIICDTDVSRAWAPIKPKNSRIKFLVPNENVKKKLLMYGVKEKNIFISGFPLPMENIGANKEIILTDLTNRISKLDPKGIYQEKYESLIEDIEVKNQAEDNNPIEITFAVGGAGAQKEIGILILNKLTAFIKNKKIKLNLVAGNRQDVKEYFIDAIKELNLVNEQGIKIIFAPDKTDYFRMFNECLRNTDILWTKPSELSFYCALGLPIIISTPVGSQEVANNEWLISIGAGIDSLDPEYVNEWLPDLLDSGRLARAAVDGFLNAEQMGTYNISNIIK
ncbi:MAG: DUF6938 domain-containing protein [Patescibacteria group bacterium]